MCRTKKALFYALSHLLFKYTFVSPVFQARISQKKNSENCPKVIPNRLPSKIY
jgi:hypothetical protein